MLNFYGRKYPRNIKGDQLKKLYDFKFFLDKSKIKTFETKIKKFETFNLEIGFGVGENIFAQSVKNDKDLFLGCDPYLSGSFNLKKDIKTFGLKNLFFTNLGFLELFEFLKNTFFTKIVILFPDPWPKKRHKKRRIVNEEFLKKIFAILKKSGKVFFSTDNLDYYINVKAIIKKFPYIKVKKVDKMVTIKTKFYLKAEKKGNKINSLLFSKY